MVAARLWLYPTHTISDYLFAIKRFFKFTRFGNVDRETPYPEEARWIKTAMKPNERSESNDGGGRPRIASRHPHSERTLKDKRHKT